jgi:tetratricopeptide (TPR) repeat protein
VQVRVARVFPDLSRFAYAANHKMEDPAESLKFMQMVATIVTESPRYYVITPAGPEVTNTVAQYGPPGAAEPNAWQTIRRKDDGSGRLVKAKLSAEAKADFDRGAAAAGKRDQTGAVGAYKAAIAKSPDVPALRIALAEVLAKGGDGAGAQAAYEAALGIDPTIATAHAGLAEIHEKRGDLPKARRSIAEALSYHPSSRRAFDLAERITRGAASAGRVRPYRVFFDVTPAGAVRVAAPGGMPGQMYASCRAVMRYEPEVRAAIFEQSEATPYYLSVVEEVVCLEAAIGAYIFERHKSDDAEHDATVEALFELAQSEGLLGFAMFEILGQHRPERARTAPSDVHRAVVQYVERHVLGEGQPLPAGVYNAMR